MKKIRKKIRMYGMAGRPRLVVYKSLRYVYAQIVDDSNQKTLVGASCLSKEVRSQLKKTTTKADASRLVGKLIADRAKAKKIKRVIFDRNGYTYHGRVKELAEGARGGGLEF